MVRNMKWSMNHLEYLDDTLFIVGDIDGFKDFAVFATSKFLNKLIVFLVAPLNNMGFVVPIITRSMRVNIGIYS